MADRSTEQLPVSTASRWAVILLVVLMLLSPVLYEAVAVFAP